MDRAIRVAISSPATGCYNCAAGLVDGVDYCASCQNVYVSETAQRSDYADQTVGYFSNFVAADSAAAQLVPSH